MRRSRGRALLASACLLLGTAARADELRLITPNDIGYRELEIEHDGSVGLGHGADGGGFYSIEFGTGATAWWHTGVELDVEREGGPDSSTAVQGVTLENQIRLTRPGENWLDAALYSELSRSTLRGGPDDVLVGAALLKDVGRTTHTLNLFFDKAFSTDDDYRGVRFSYAWQSRWNLYRQFAPAIEAFGESGRVDRPDSFQSGQLIAGPMATGVILLGPLGKLRYEAGYLFGVTDASPSGTIRWKMEMEIPL